MHIRHAVLEDLKVLAALEAASYPAAESGTEQDIKQRLEHFPDAYWLLENEAHEVVAFISGMLTGQADLTDEMYHHPEMHDEQGGWLMIFSVVTAPEHRGRGYAGTLMKQVIADMQAQRRQGIVLACKEKLLGFYGQFGFASEGVSASTHGGAVWYQMRLRLER